MSVRHLAIMLILSTIMTFAIPGSADDTVRRTWTDVTGNFTVDAEFVDVANGKVRLKKADGQVITVELEQLSSADQEYLRAQAQGSEEGGVRSVAASALTGKSVELKSDDGKPAGKKSFPRGIASAFETDEDGYFVTSVRIHGGRYGTLRPPREDFHVSLCDKDFHLIADFDFPYSKFERGDQKWVALRVKPTEVPREFVICLNFNPTRNKGVYVSHDVEGTGLVGLANKPAGSFTGGDWMVRATVDRLKDRP